MLVEVFLFVCLFVSTFTRNSFAELLQIKYSTNVFASKSAILHGYWSLTCRNNNSVSILVLVAAAFSATHVVPSNSGKTFLSFYVKSNIFLSESMIWKTWIEKIYKKIKTKQENTRKTHAYMRSKHSQCAHEKFVTTANKSLVLCHHCKWIMCDCMSHECGCVPADVLDALLNALLA